MPPVDRVAQVELALDHVLPERGVGVLEVGQPHLGAGVQRVDRHLAVGRPGDLGPPVDQPGRVRRPPATSRPRGRPWSRRGSPACRRRRARRTAARAAPAARAGARRTRGAGPARNSRASAVSTSSYRSSHRCVDADGSRLRRSCGTPRSECGSGRRVGERPARELARAAARRRAARAPGRARCRAGRGRPTPRSASAARAGVVQVDPAGEHERPGRRPRAPAGRRPPAALPDSVCASTEPSPVTTRSAAGERRRRTPPGRAAGRCPASVGRRGMPRAPAPTPPAAPAPATSLTSTPRSRRSTCGEPDQSCLQRRRRPSGTAPFCGP